MSTAGIYNAHVVIEEGPEKFKAQLATQQPPFFFGGSQVPEALGFMSGSGISTPYRSAVIDGKIKPSSKVIQYPSTNQFRSTVIPKILPLRR